VRAGDVLQAVLRRVTVLPRTLDQVVGGNGGGTLALGERVHELGDVAAGLPHPRARDDRGVQPDDVVPLLTIALHHLLMLFFISTPSGP
jgi:hypothetical protein